MIQICDIEIARNLFLIGLKDYPSEKETLLEVSEHVDERKQFLTWYNSKTRKDLLVTFNGISYDVPVINFAYNIFSKDTSSLREQLLLIHNYSQSLIEKGKRKKKVKGYYTDLFGEKHTVYENEDEDEEFVNDPFFKGHNWTDIDLFRYWARSIRISKKISLKSLGIALGYENVKDLPFDPNKDIEDISTTRLYLHDDIRITYKVMLELKEKINFRSRFQEKEIYEILPNLDKKFNFMSYDEPKIVTSVINYLLQDEVPDTSPKKINIADIVLSDIEAPDICVKGTDINALEYMKSKVVKSTSEISFSAEVNYKTHRLLLDFGAGGIHGISRKGIIEPPKGYTILDIDISSMYPSFIIEHKFSKYKILPNILREWRTKRFSYKRKGNTFLSDLFKLFLNATYGMYGNKHSILYDLKSLLQVTVNGQMYILDLINKLYNKKDIEVFFANTDGITMFVKEEDLESIKEFINSHGDKFKLIWEYQEYSKMFLKDVNNYIAIYKNGKVKRKGCYEYNVNIIDSVDQLIVPYVVEQYLVYGKDIITTLKEEKDILKFCLSKKVSKDYNVLYNNRIIQNLNRFIVSKKGSYLYKKKVKGKNVTGNLSHIMKDNPVIIYNDFSNKDIDINYSYYKQEILKLIELFDNQQQTLF